ncbi:MAG: efflux transporter outer membrane subunit [Deltaproteobacteria bacterium]|jgi:Cu(I)/Ag(I) efflux system outer membrane protein|nr:efflux transporter outer membrane subunit [Deltaproteobacteria bacterium]
MQTRTPRKIVGLALLLLPLASCSLAPQYDRPEAPVPAALTETELQAPAGEAFDAQGLGWREFFKDEQLKELIALSLENNRDVKLAALSVAEAQARYGVQSAERLPQLTAEGGADMSGGFRRSTEKSYDFAVAMPAFELDFFGRLKNMSESALEQYLASREAEKTVRLTLVSQVAQGWLEERLAREQLQLARQSLESWQTSYAFIEGRASSGQSSPLDLEQARGMVEFASAAVAQRQREVTRAANALYLLLGSFEKRELPTAASLAEQNFAELPDNLSSTVLLSRPDVMEAEHMLLAANADIGAARAAFFPSISLTGNLGYMSDDVTTLFSGTTSVWSFLPSLSLPIFAAGRNKANLELAEIRKESSVLQYEKTIQTAFREVADALMTRASFNDQLAAQKKYLAAQRLVLALATQRYVNGVTSYLDVLDAQRNVFQAEQDLLDIRREQLVNEINLYSALGGGLAETSASLPGGLSE